MFYLCISLHRMLYVVLLNKHLLFHIYVYNIALVTLLLTNNSIPIHTLYYRFLKAHTIQIQ